MTGLVRKASLLAVLGLLAASVAVAGVPDPTQSVVPTYFDLVGCSGGVIDPYGAFTVTVNDAAGNPVQGCEVKIVFQSDLKVYDTISGLTVDCGNRAVIATSDATGVANFNISGATINPNGVAAGAGAGGAEIFACEISLGFATVGVFDESGAVGVLGVGGADLTGWLGDFGKQGTIGYKGRSDFNHDGAIGGADLSKWLQRFGSGASSSSCGTLCAY
ncbi:MAG: hypothetical protein QUV05_19820 [Phycisphaerae bacterium]|nr:hypothetical protein [Phycisphaerae bacterium]